MNVLMTGATGIVGLPTLKQFLEKDYFPAPEITPENISKTVRFAKEIDEVNWQQVSKIFSAIGWSQRSPENVKLAFQRSSFVRFAYLDNELVGMGRTVDDGVYYGWIVDLALLPEYQGKGIGTYILKELEKDLKPLSTTMLTAEPGKNEFYEKLGWLKQTAAYIWPRSEEQKRAFTENR